MVSAWPSSTGSAVVYLPARWQSDQSDPWQWRWGFYPEPDPGECTSGTAASFESARAAFTVEWAVFLSKRTEADLKDCWQERDWTASSYSLATSSGVDQHAAGARPTPAAIYVKRLIWFAHNEEEALLGN